VTQKKIRKPNPRTLARQRALQALYQWRLGSQSLVLIEEQFFAEEDMQGVDLPYFQQLLHQIPKQAKELDEKLEPLLDRPLRRLDPVEHAALHIGLYELQACLEVPWKVVINEAVELAKRFGAEQSHKYINGILDKAAVNRIDRVKK